MSETNTRALIGRQSWVSGFRVQGTRHSAEHRKSCRGDTPDVLPQPPEKNTGPFLGIACPFLARRVSSPQADVSNPLNRAECPPVGQDISNVLSGHGVGRAKKGTLERFPVSQFAFHGDASRSLWPDVRDELLRRGGPCLLRTGPPLQSGANSVLEIPKGHGSSPS